MKVGVEIKLLEPLDENTQLKLFKEYRETNDLGIREKLILHNLKLVSWTIKNYYDKNILEYDDYFQIGTIGLMRAIESYDYTKGAFSTYATYSIKQSITRDIENLGRTIRVPSHMIGKINKLNQVKEELSNILEREPTIKEISLKMKLSIKEVNNILESTDEPKSLNIPIGDKDSTLENMIEDTSPSPAELVEVKMFIEEFKEVSRKKLSDIQYNVLAMYLGIGMRKHSLKEITDKYNYKSNKSIIRIRKKAIEILKDTRFIMELQNIVDEETSYYKGVDYTQPSSKGNLPSSSVENIVLDREKRLEILKQGISHTIA